MPEIDYYTVLNLPRTASENDIKKAYHKMALRWHPDKNQDKKEEAERKFKEISEAYQVLSDKDKKAIYDRYGKSGLTGVNANSSAGAQQRSRKDYTRTSRHSQNVQPDFEYFGPSFTFSFRSPEEVFAEFFGGRSPFDDLLRTFDSFDLSHSGTSGRDGEARRQTQRQTRRPQHHRSAVDLVVDFNDDLFKFTSSSYSWNDSFPSSWNISSGKNVRKTSTSTQMKNGKKIVTKRTLENGVETVTVEENGVLKSREVRHTAELL